MNALTRYSTLRIICAFFLADRLLEWADLQVAAWEGTESCVVKQFDSVNSARSWHERVRRWVENTRTDLAQDSVPAPRGGGKRWLLYASEALSVESDTNSISCRLGKNVQVRSERMLALVNTRSSLPCLSALELIVCGTGLIQWSYGTSLTPSVK